MLLQHVNFMSQKMIVACESDRVVNVNIVIIVNMKMNIADQRLSPWGFARMCATTSWNRIGFQPSCPSA